MRPPPEKRTFGRGGTGAGWVAGEREHTRRNREGRLPPRLGDPDREEAAEMIESQVCWWCGRGPFRSISSHTQSHGITAAEIRRLAYLYKHTRIASDDLHDRYSRRTSNLPALQKARRAMKPRARQYSEAGKAANIAKLERARSPEQRRLATQRAIEVRSRPHPCHVCGKIIPRAHPYTCSPECRREVRRRTARMVSANRLATKQGA